MFVDCVPGFSSLRWLGGFGLGQSLLVWLLLWSLPDCPRPDCLFCWLVSVEAGHGLGLSVSPASPFSCVMGWGCEQFDHLGLPAWRESLFG